MVKLIKPDVVSHCDSKKYRCVIYSIDFQPNSFRIATAGGGMFKVLTGCLIVSLFICY